MTMEIKHAKFDSFSLLCNITTSDGVTEPHLQSCASVTKALNNTFRNVEVRGIRLVDAVEG